MPASSKQHPTHKLNLPHGAGRAGEAAAVDFLRSRGYAIETTNFRVNEGEIDIVARHGGETVFVEVKTRRSAAFGKPEESLSEHKINRLVTAAQSYLSQTGHEQSEWRIDLVAVELDRSGHVLRINHVQNAIEF